jgi:hypothetical protein
MREMFNAQLSIFNPEISGSFINSLFALSEIEGLNIENCLLSIEHFSFA